MFNFEPWFWVVLAVLLVIVTGLVIDDINGGE